MKEGMSLGHVKQCHSFDEKEDDKILFLLYNTIRIIHSAIIFMKR